jgi:prepilin-type N-terminal cleavage/methylation domain-containing protein
LTDGGVFTSMTGRRGFTLIEVVIVVAIIAISFGLAEPRIGAGLGRLDLNNAAKTVQTFLKMARLQAERTDQQQYVLLDRARRSVSLVSPDLKVLRSSELPASVEILIESGTATAAFSVPPSGIIRGSPVRLRGRTGEIEVSFQ